MTKYSEFLNDALQPRTMRSESLFDKIIKVSVECVHETVSPSHNSRYHSSNHLWCLRLEIDSELSNTFHQLLILERWEHDDKLGPFYQPDTRVFKRSKLFPIVPKKIKVWRGFQSLHDLIKLLFHTKVYLIIVEVEIRLVCATHTPTTRFPQNLKSHLKRKIVREKIQLQLLLFRRLELITRFSSTKSASKRRLLFSERDFEERLRFNSIQLSGLDSWTFIYMWEKSKTPREKQRN